MYYKKCIRCSNPVHLGKDDIVFDPDPNDNSMLVNIVPEVCPDCYNNGWRIGTDRFGNSFLVKLEFRGEPEFDAGEYIPAFIEVPDVSLLDLLTEETN